MSPGSRTVKNCRAVRSASATASASPAYGNSSQPPPPITGTAASAANARARRHVFGSACVASRHGSSRNSSNPRMRRDAFAAARIFSMSSALQRLRRSLISRSARSDSVTDEPPMRALRCGYRASQSRARAWTRCESRCVTSSPTTSIKCRSSMRPVLRRSRHSIRRPRALPCSCHPFAPKTLSASRTIARARLEYGAHQATARDGDGVPASRNSTEISLASSKTLKNARRRPAFTAPAAIDSANVRPYRRAVRARRTSSTSGRTASRIGIAATTPASRRRPGERSSVTCSTSSVDRQTGASASRSSKHSSTGAISVQAVAPSHAGLSVRTWRSALSGSCTTATTRAPERT